MERAQAENPNQAAEYVRLFKVHFDKLSGFPLDVLDGLSNVGYLQIRGERHSPVESLCIKAQMSPVGSDHARNGNESTCSPCRARRIGAAVEDSTPALSSASLGMARSATR